MKLPLIILITLLIGCSTVHKTASKTKTSTDSTATTKTEAVRVVRADSTGANSVKADYWRETVYLYDTVYQDTGRTLIKYVPRIIRVVETGSFLQQDQAAKSSSDSSQVDTKQTVQVSKQTVAKTTEKQKETRSWVPWLIGACVAAVLWWFWWRVRRIAKKL